MTTTRHALKAGALLGRHPVQHGRPAGGGYSTAADMARFMEALFAGMPIDAKRVGAATAGNFDMWPGTKYGYGFWDSEKSDRAVRGHAGGGSGYGINVDVNHMPAAKVGGDRFSVVVLSNYDPPVAQDFAQDVAKFLAPREETAGCAPEGTLGHSRPSQVGPYRPDQRRPRFAALG